MFVNAYFSLVFILMFVNDKSMVRLYGSMVALIFITICIYSLAYHVHAHVKKSHYARLIYFFGISFVVSSIHGSVIFLANRSGMRIGLPDDLPIAPLHFCFLLLYSGIAVVLVTRFISMMKKIDGLNEQLNNYIEENNRLSEKLKSSGKKPVVSITDKTEKKLKEVITYIHENFRSDLTINELAELAGTRPDSFGKRFKLYIGKKLWDYIYELRIEEAARLLREEDRNIIDIAFDVGFESLRTFNRVFPKFMNTTPGMYRKSYRNSNNLERTQQKAS